MHPPLVFERYKPSPHNRKAGAAAAKRACDFRRLRRTWNRRLSAAVRSIV